VAVNKSSKSQEQQLDDLLSNFTDQVLSDENAADMQEMMAQHEMAELQKTVLRLKAAAQKARTSDNADVRIRNRLLMEWKKTRQAERPAPKRFTWNWTFPRLALAGGLAVLILIGAVTLISPSTTPLTATSAGSSTSPLFIIVGIVIIAYLLWHNRHD
jgi:anti-sigma factor RsiW